MTRKHFEAFAAQALLIADAGERKIFALRCAAVFHADNPRFDLARFLWACNVAVEVRLTA